MKTINKSKTDTIFPNLENFIIFTKQGIAPPYLGDMRSSKTHRANLAYRTSCLQVGSFVVLIGRSASFVLSDDHVLPLLAKGDEAGIPA